MTDHIAFFGAKTIDEAEQHHLHTLGRLLAYSETDLVLTSASGASMALRSGFEDAGGKPVITDRLPTDRNWLMYINASSAMPIIERFPVKAPETTWIAGLEKLEVFIEATMAILDQEGRLPTRA